MATLGRFWLFSAFFRQFFYARIGRSQNKGNSYYKNLENNIPLDFVIGILPILSTWDATSKKTAKIIDQKWPKSAKNAHFGSKIFFGQKLKHTNRTFVRERVRERERGVNKTTELTLKNMTSRSKIFGRTHESLLEEP